MKFGAKRCAGLGAVGEELEAAKHDVDARREPWNLAHDVQGYGL